MQDVSVDIHWDAGMWRLASAHMRAEIKKWVSDNKGKGPKKLILSDPLISLHPEDVRPGFFLARMTNKKVDLTVVNASWKLVPETFREIELSIVRAAMDKGLLPRSVKYAGQLVEVSKPTLSTDRRSVKSGFLYFVRNGDLFKIGITENLIRRLGELNPDEVMDVVRCSNCKELEKKLHRRFSACRIPQTEYFRMTQQDIESVHMAMASESVR